jgi:hypothetical protein
MGESLVFFPTSSIPMLCLLPVECVPTLSTKRWGRRVGAVGFMDSHAARRLMAGGAHARREWWTDEHAQVPEQGVSGLGLSGLGV